MSGGESRPPSIRARFGVLGHTSGGNYTFNRLHWDIDKHKKRLKAIRQVIQPWSKTASSKTRPRQPPYHPWFGKQ
jgi:hypothetical protein